MRVYEVQGLKTNGVSVGGLASLGFDATHKEVHDSEADLAGGLEGVQEVDRSILRVGASAQITDLAKINAILDAAPGATTFSGKQVGSANFSHYTMSASSIVWTGFNMTIPKVGDGTVDLSGVVQFSDGSKTMKDLFAVATPTSVAPPLTYPARLYRGHTASFTPDGGVAITPLHLETVSLSLSASEVQEDFDAADIGLTVVERGPWGALDVSMTFKDYTIAAGSDKCSELLDAGWGVLTATLLGRAGAANKTLTVNKLLWTGSSRTNAKKFWQWTVKGRASWYKDSPVTFYKLNSGTKLFEIV